MVAPSPKETILNLNQDEPLRRILTRSRLCAKPPRRTLIWKLNHG